MDKGFFHPLHTVQTYGIILHMDTAEIKLTDEQRRTLGGLGVVLCYVHGSVAAGTARADSDVDIAILFERQPEDPIQATTAIIQALDAFAPGREIDVATLNDASPLLAQSVAARGTLLYARSSDDVLRFQMHTMHEYESSRHIVYLGQQLALARAQVKV